MAIGRSRGAPPPRDPPSRPGSSRRAPGPQISRSRGADGATGDQTVDVRSQEEARDIGDRRRTEEDRDWPCTGWRAGPGGVWWRWVPQTPAAVSTDMSEPAGGPWTTHGGESPPDLSCGVYMRQDGMRESFITLSVFKLYWSEATTCDHLLTCLTE